MMYVAKVLDKVPHKRLLSKRNLWHVYNQTKITLHLMFPKEQLWVLFCSLCI